MLEDSPLGQTVTVYPREHDSSLLFGIPRRKGRQAIGLHGDTIPFGGVDIWNGYEISWLNARGKPLVAAVELRFPSTSERLIESKSLKLYFNSLSFTVFESPHGVERLVASDLSRAAGDAVQVRLIMRPGFDERIGEFPGLCIDDQDIAIDTYDVCQDFLEARSGPLVEEMLFSNLLRSNCPVTGQPDWGSVLIHYRGPRLDAAGLLRYFVSFRNHSAFHEQCVEQIFVDLQARCHCEQLTVYGRYTRRGGFDINPFRSNFEAPPVNRRLYRQ